MAITQTVTKYQIVDIAKAYNRLDTFGYHGWQKLFDYMEELSDSMGKDIELDIVAWCGDFSICESIQDFRDAFHMDLTDEEWGEKDNEEKLKEIKAFLQDNTSIVCCEEDCIIFQVF